MAVEIEDGAPVDITWEVLNAHVDGELSPSEAAEVSAAMARDPSLARRVATLTRLKTATRALSTGVPVPAPVASALRPARAPVRRAIAIAASLLALFLATGFLVRHFDGERADVASLESAVLAYRQWASAADSEPDGAATITPALGRAEGLPDLGAAAFRLVHLAGDPALRLGGIFAGYRGARGCDLGLWMAPAAVHGTSRPRAVVRASLRIRVWSVEDVDYALISRKMDPQRLDRLADILAETTHRGRGDERIARLAALGSGTSCRA